MLKQLLRSRREDDTAIAGRHVPGTWLVFLVSGAGIQQTLAEIERLIAQKDFRPILLINESPSWNAVMMRDRVEGLMQHLNIQVVHVLQEPPADWVGETGVIELDIMVRYLPDDPKSSEYFISGPEPTRQRLATALQQLGVPRQNIHEH